jgi:hypothetical protein
VRVLHLGQAVLIEVLGIHSFGFKRTQTTCQKIEKSPSQRREAGLSNGRQHASHPKFMKRKKTGTSDEKKLRQREELAFATSLSHVGC